MDFKKRIDEIKERERNKDSERSMDNPFAEIADVVIHMHVDDDEFKQIVRNCVIKELGTEMTTKLLKEFKDALGTENDTLIAATYMSHAVEFLKKTVESTIVKEDHNRVYKNIIRFFMDSIKE